MDLSYVSEDDFEKIPKDKLMTICKITPLKRSIFYDKDKKYYYTDELTRYYTPDVPFKFCKSNRTQKYYRYCLACGINRFIDEIWNKSKYAPGRPGDGELVSYCRSSYCRAKWIKHTFDCTDYILYGEKSW
ncbi:zinc finger protein [Cotonvirus japonicus]|uniref:Zinc finger protein n=1 Tax=Cotonvirus japonicus TaxID=2811091 RepID=A0ABM7NQZ4_9VIRU|nr:zinc finger protein [Cotonvirus japonicus]BCS82570.1 zinc finger protein [Cotonvirus japonicus]